MMKDRIKTIRQHYDLTQKEFGEKLGTVKSGISRIESGATPPTERALRLILSEFPVNETWLRDGIGDMLSNDTASRKARLVEQYNKEGDPFKNWLLDQIIEMNDEQWKLLKTKIHEAADLCRDKGNEMSTDVDRIAAKLFSNKN
jgi:transcriptional regulator with XRE-family HTH domain